VLPEECEVLGDIYDRALLGERCWLRHRDGRVGQLPIANWIGGHGADHHFDSALLALCVGRTLDLGCGPGRLVTQLVSRGLPALGVDRSAQAVELARRNGAPVLHADIFDPLPFSGDWQTVLLADGNIGVGGDPLLLLARAADLLTHGGRCIVEFDTAPTGVLVDWMRLETSREIGPWFRWASVGIDAAADLARRVGMTVESIHSFGDRVVACLSRRSHG
jgi:SAM-dependent methyltransferase